MAEHGQRDLQPLQIMLVITWTLYFTCLILQIQQIVVLFVYTLYYYCTSFIIQMMPNTQIKLDSCQICNQILKNIAIKCDLCEAVFHKRFTNLTQQQLRLIHCKNLIIFVYHVVRYFHFRKSVMMNLFMKTLLLKILMIIIN